MRTSLAPSTTQRKICFVGLDSLPVLAPEYGHHGIGGEQVQHTLLAKSLTRRGYTVCMAVHDYGQADGASWHQIQTHKTYRTDSGIPVLRFVHPRMTSLWRALMRANAHVYYVSCASMQLGIVALFCRLYRRQVVFRVAHDRVCDPQDLLVQYWRDRKLYEYGLRRAHAILVQSHAQQRALLANYRLHSKVAAMLVEAEPIAGGLAQRDIDVLWVNNLRAFKRPDRMIDLARQLPHLRCHMIGGPQEGFAALFDTIKAQAATVPNLTFHGQVPYHAMQAYYARARVFVNTSDSEGFPNSFLQAWAQGTPVVSFFDPDQVIHTHQLGQAVTDMADMVRAVDTLARQPAHWAHASTRCQAYIAQRYSEDQVLAPYIDSFAKVAP